MSNIVGFLLIVLSVGLIVIIGKKPAVKYNNPLAADFRGYIAGCLLIVIGLIIFFNKKVLVSQHFYNLNMTAKNE